MPIPVVVNVYNDRSVRLHHQEPAGRRPAQAGRRHRQGLGRAEQGQGRHGHPRQIDDIVKLKMADLNARDVEHAKRMIEGTARSMGLNVDGLTNRLSAAYCIAPLDRTNRFTS